MLTTPSIRQIPTSRPDLFAFRIHGEVAKDDMTAMAQYMNDVFDTEMDKVDMMLIFDPYDGAEAGAGWSWEALRSRFKSVYNVNRYVVVGAPEHAKNMIETIGRIIPVKAESFDDEEQAWIALDAQSKAA